MSFARRLKVVAVLGLALGLAGWQLGRRYYRFPGHNLERPRPCQVFTDCEDNVIWATIGDDDNWRLPVPLRQISPTLIAATLAAEDKRFWTHGGVDWLAVARATTSNASAGRIVSGASTVTMQLAKLAQPEPRSWGTKLRQTWRALDAESQHSKAWILEAYLNHAPYGSNLIGVEAASRYYFRKPAADLSWEEATLLAGLPQRPAAFRLDRHPDAAARRQRFVEARLRACRPDMAPEIPRPSRLYETSRYRLTTPDETCKLGLPMREPMVAELAAMESDSPQVQTTLDPVLQALSRESIRTQVGRLPGVEDGAAVIIENQTGAIRALIGTLDFNAQPTGQVNAATARRSPGSALKPFIYLLALESGWIIPETMLDDGPVVLPDYRPENFDQRFSAPLPARQALTHSRNTPAVRIVGRLSPARLLAILRAVGMRSLDRSADCYGLTLALGGGEVTLLELTNAYAGLARGGDFRPCRITTREKQDDDRQPAATRPFGPGSVQLLADMLATYPLPGSPTVPLAWKTGTSNGFRDAWCIAFNRDYTIGVWLGNKNGRPAASLVGVEAAAPVVADLALALYRDRPVPPVTPTFPANALAPVTACAASGLRCTAHCPTTTTTQHPRNIPLRTCEQRHDHAATLADPRPATPVPNPAAPQILEPFPDTYLPSNGTARLNVRSDCHEPLDWFVDGRYIGTRTGEFRFTFAPGRHRLTCLRRASGQTADATFAVASARVAPARRNSQRLTGNE